MAADNTTLGTAEQREAFFMSLYKKSFAVVARYVCQMGGSMEAAQDIFQDTLVIYYEQCISTQKKPVLNERAYLLGIAKNLWLQQHKANSRYQPMNDIDIAAVHDEQPSTQKLLHYLESSGKKCMDLLKAYYYHHLPVNQLAARFGYSGTHSATVAKYKCLEKVRNTIKQKSLDYADFIE